MVLDKGMDSETVKKMKNVFVNRRKSIMLGSHDISYQENYKYFDNIYKILFDITKLCFINLLLLDNDLYKTCISHCKFFNRRKGSDNRHKECYVLIYTRSVLDIKDVGQIIDKFKMVPEITLLFKKLIEICDRFKEEEYNDNDKMVDDVTTILCNEEIKELCEDK